MLARFQPGNSTAIPVFPENSDGALVTEPQRKGQRALLGGIEKKMKFFLGVSVSILDTIS